MRFFAVFLHNLEIDVHGPFLQICACILQMLAVYYRLRADVAQAVEHLLGKEEVMGSSPIISSSQIPWTSRGFFVSIGSRQAFTRTYVRIMLW